MSQKTADFRRFTPFSWTFPAFGGRRKPQKAADFRRKVKICAENRKKPQIGLRHLRCVAFSSALKTFHCPKFEQENKLRHEKRAQTQTFLVWISSGGVGVLHVNGWEPKSSVCPSKPREIKLLGRDIPGSCWDIPAVPERIEKYQRTAKRASGKGQRQKTSKSLKKYFRQLSRRAKNVKKCQKYFRLFSTVFARRQFSGPFWGALSKKNVCVFDFGPYKYEKIHRENMQGQPRQECPGFRRTA